MVVAVTDHGGGRMRTEALPFCLQVLRPPVQPRDSSSPPPLSILTPLCFFRLNYLQGCVVVCCMQTSEVASWRQRASSQSDNSGQRHTFLLLAGTKVRVTCYTKIK